jgi:protein-glutamine gamma-glutamyltransferase
MIRISNAYVDPKKLGQQWKLNDIGLKLLRLMSESERIYEYEYVEQLHFEVILRTNIVKASYDLNRADPEFSTFAKSHCNPRYWQLTSDGGFLIKAGVLPSTGIRDIFRHGGLYGFECATAMVIVLYKAMLDTIPENTFNRLFSRLLLWDGNYDEDLKIESVDEFDPLPGDILYIKNPDVDPKEIEWQGENVVDLGNGTYYGHGIGITSIRRIIYMLNKHRRRNAEESAYLTDYVLRPDFKRMASLDGSVPTIALREVDDDTVQDLLKGLFVVQLGNTTYIKA